MDARHQGELLTYKCIPRPEWYTLVSTVIVMAVVTGLMAHYQVHWYWIVLADVALFVGGLSIGWWPVIEVKNGLVREKAMLFQRKVLAEQTTPFSEFKEVFCQLHEDDGSKQYWVGLRRLGQPVIWVKECGAERRFAEELAWKISCETGIPLQGDTPSKEQFINDDRKFET